MLQYTLVQRVNPQDPEAPKKWFASPKTVQRLDLSETCKRATRHTSIAPAEVKAALELLVEVLPEMLGDSNSIDIGIGTLRISYGSEGAESPEEFNVELIRNPKLIYTPSKSFLNAVIQAMAFENAGVVENGFTYPSVDDYRKYKVAEREAGQAGQ